MSRSKPLPLARLVPALALLAAGCSVVDWPGNRPKLPDRVASPGSDAADATRIGAAGGRVPVRRLPAVDDQGRPTCPDGGKSQRHGPRETVPDGAEPRPAALGEEPGSQGRPHGNPSPGFAESRSGHRRSAGAWSGLVGSPGDWDGLAGYLPGWAAEEVLAEPRPHPASEPASFVEAVYADHKNYYSPSGMGGLAFGTGMAAVMANTGADAGLQDAYQGHFRDMRTDELAEALHTPKVLGNGYATIPLFAGAAWVGSWFEGFPVAEAASQWGQRSLRAVLVGGPPMLAMQRLTGGSRPGEAESRSGWRPLQDDNGVSGHSFMGAIPFLSAAMMTPNPILKGALYVGSTLAGFSRINDDRHYPSQVLLGWWMAWAATAAVDRTQRGEADVGVVPVPVSDGVGWGIEYRR